MTNTKSLLRGRSQAQFDFDWQAHGWAFSHKELLAARITTLTEIAQQLAPNHERHGRLEFIREALKKMEAGEARKENPL